MARHGPPSRPSLRPTITKTGPGPTRRAKACSRASSMTTPAIGSSPAMRPKTASVTDITSHQRQLGVPSQRLVYQSSGYPPATMIDELLRVKLQSYLSDKAQISNLLRETRCRPAEIGRGIRIASELADSLTSASPMAHNVADLVARVTASHRSLKISIKRDRLLATLRDKFVEQSQDDGQDNVISLEVTVPAVSGGGSSKLIFEDKNAKTPDAVVVKAIARASIWFEQLTAGNSQSMAQIAVRETITDNYVSNLIHLAWLSPDLVGRVLQGDSEATALAKTALLTRKSETLWRGR